MRGRRPLRVLGAHREPSGTTNPYLIQLTRDLQRDPTLDYRALTFPRALLWRYDVLHLHWPEVVMGGHRRSGRAVRQALTFLLWLRLKLRGTAVVRTLHNLGVPGDASRTERYLLGRLDRVTDVFIMLNRHAAPDDRPSRVIPHGHYVDWFEKYPQVAPQPGHAVFVGLVRRYKGVEELVRAFRQTTRSDLSLSVHGRPSTSELSAEIDELIAGDPRLETDWRFLDEPDLVASVTGASLVVLPYREMYNSGVVLMALSLGRPVLVPDNAINRDLADEVGPGWVRTFTPPLDAGALVGAMDAGVPPVRPDLAGRDWARVAQEHVAVYRLALRS